MRWVNDLRRHRLHEVISRQAYGDAVGFEARGVEALPLLYCTGTLRYGREGANPSSVGRRSAHFGLQSKDCLPCTVLGT